MSNLDTAPTEQDCHRPDAAISDPVLLPAREVPLGGVRSMSVSRTLPSKAVPMVGAWCFFDQMGPERVEMKLLPHPHIGLQTVTWPLEGRIRHRDSLGSDVVITPGELDLMTSGVGISHSEFSVEPDGTAGVLHALQLWVALPQPEATGPGRFEQHRDLPGFQRDGLTATVFIGELDGARSPALVHTPLLGAELTIAAETSTSLPIRSDFEHAILLIDGEITVAGTTLDAGPLLYLGPGRDELRIASDRGARFVLLGGAPFPDDLVMWWNFVGRSHDEIVAARTDWENHSERFGLVDGHGPDRVPAPPMPDLRLTPRRRMMPR